ncbi:MAG TPA: sulfotransferase [Anaerolineae bacterium]|nr:sulfotransferase [Anaerolineae bacterium]
MPPSHVFIGGLHRTGTSLLRRTLNSSGHIAICGETHYLGGFTTLACWLSLLRRDSPSDIRHDQRYTRWRATPGTRQLFARMGDISTPDGARQVIDFVYDRTDTLDWTFWRWLPKNVVRDEFLGKFLESERNDRSLLDLLMSCYAEGKPIRGEKTPAHIHHVPTLLAWFPHAIFIHTFRDPRAIFVSEKQKQLNRGADRLRHRLLQRSRFAHELYLSFSIAVHWTRIAQLHRQYQQRYPDRYYLLKFEDLIADPETRLREVCGVLDIDLSENMLQQKVLNSSFLPLRGQPGFDASAIDRWRQRINLVVAGWITRLCKTHLVEFGYPL